MNYVEIEQALQNMKPRQRLFHIIKAELKRRGHWKNKSRGKAMSKGFDSRRGSMSGGAK